MSIMNTCRDYFVGALEWARKHGLEREFVCWYKKMRREG
jgi:hypothetical protein